MNKAIKLLAVLPVVLLLSACGISAGTVSAKVIEPAHSYTSLVKVGKSLIPMTHNVPEAYCFTVTNAKQEKGKVCLKKSDWEEVSNGSYYNADAK